METYVIITIFDSFFSIVPWPVAVCSVAKGFLGELVECIYVNISFGNSKLAWQPSYQYPKICLVRQSQLRLAQCRKDDGECK